jgi:hypothetical protein
MKKSFAVSASFFERTATLTAAASPAPSGS